MYDCCRWNTTVLYIKACPIASTVLQCSVVEHAAFPAAVGATQKPRVSKRKVFQRRFLRKKQKTPQKMWHFPCFLGPFIVKSSFGMYESSAYDELRGSFVGILNSPAFHVFFCRIFLLAHLKTKDTKIQTEISQRIWEYFWMLHLESTKIFWGVQDKGVFSLGKDSNSAGELKFPKFFFLDKTWNLFVWICVSVVGVCSYFRGERPVEAFVEMF